MSHLRVGIHIGVALLIGCIFYDIGGQAGHARDNFSLIFFSIIFIMFTSYSSAVMYCKLFKKNFGNLGINHKKSGKIPKLIHVFFLMKKNHSVLESPKKLKAF